jgi:hypothetical protein
VVYVQNDHGLGMAREQELKIQVLGKGFGAGGAVRRVLKLGQQLACSDARRTISILRQSGGFVWHVLWRGTRSSFPRDSPTPCIDCGEPSHNGTFVLSAHISYDLAAVKCVSFAMLGLGNPWFFSVGMLAMGRDRVD